MDGIGAGFGVRYGFPETFMQMMQLHSSDLLQLVSNRIVSVTAVPKWHSAVCISRTISEDSGCLDGRR